jgi:DNA-binding CsgD family transcriptional regulator
MDAAFLSRIARPEKLTRAEEEVLQSILDGHTSTPDLAEWLGVSRRTIHAHLRSLYAKTNTASRVDLVLWALTERGVLGRRTDDNN